MMVSRSHGHSFGGHAPTIAGLVCEFLDLDPGCRRAGSAITWTAVLMMVLNEVDGIGRLQPFLISAGINAIFLVLL